MASLLGFKLGYCPLVCVMVLLPAMYYSQDTFTCSRATYYGSPNCYGNPTGACGFGNYGRTVNDGNVAAVSRLFRNGTGCGACYQVRCRIQKYCSDEGVNVVVTDYGEGDYTDFILTPKAYAKLALPNVALDLFSKGVIDVEYRRISCQYSYNNLKFKVHEHSNHPHYIAIVIIYVGGQNDITAAQLWQEDCKEWRGMRRSYGAVWDMENPPRGDLNLRFHVTSSAGTITWVLAKNVIPSDWKAGVVYDSAIQLS